MTRLPRRNPNVYARMYTPYGRLIHRTAGPNTQEPLCRRFPWWHIRAVEGRRPAAHLYRIEFDPAHAATLAECEKCKTMARWSL